MAAITLTDRQLERVVKGFANHRRIQVLRLLESQPDLSLQEIADRLVANLKTTGEHVRRLTVSGLVVKRSDGRSVRHNLTDQGTRALMFMSTLE